MRCMKVWKRSDPSFAPGLIPPVPSSSSSLTPPISSDHNNETIDRRLNLNSAKPKSDVDVFSRYSSAKK